MSLKSMLFVSAVKLTQFVAEKGITQANIQAVVIDASGQYVLFYWAA